jgi:T-complex protein 1 subunit alpha
MESVKVKTITGETRCPVKAVNIVKAHGQSSMDSQLVKGYVMLLQRACQQMPVKIENCKIACLDVNLHKFRM